MNPSWKKNYLRYKAFLMNAVIQYRKKAEAKIYLEMLLSLTTISILSAFALRPTLLTITKLVKDIDQKKQTLSEINNKIDNINQAKELYDKERGKIELLKYSIPDNPSPDLLIRQLEGLSAKTQVGIKSMLTDGVFLSGEEGSLLRAGEKTETDKALSFSINLEATYPELFNFLSTLENLRRPVRIDVLTFDANESDRGTLKLNIQAVSPYLGINTGTE